MGSSFVRFHDRGFEANDATLEIWLLLLVDEIDKLNDLPDWLQEVGEEWHLQATAGFGFGVMPGLDDFVTSPERRDVILDLCSKAMKRLHGYGSTISKDELNHIQKSNKGSVFTRDVRAELFEKVGEYFVKLLREELGPEEVDARLWLS